MISSLTLILSLAATQPVGVDPVVAVEPAPGPTPVAVPFAWGDFTWMNGQSRQKDFPLQLNSALTFSLYLDTYFAYSLNRPVDDTLTGSGTIGRHNEFQLNLASVGFEWNYRNTIGRLSLQYGSMINLAQDLDGTVARGRALTTQNLRYIREATAGYHFDVLSGVNVEAGIFMSYIGLESYLLAENWNYTRSLVCDHTPFYFQGIRAQIFLSDRLKVEPWVMNGWQSYGKWNFSPSAGLSVRWSPVEAFTVIGNFYGGSDTKNTPGRIRFHHDHSILWRYFQSSGLRLAFSLNNHYGFEQGGDGLPGMDQAYMAGTSIAHRATFFRDHLAVSVRGEYLTNPTRYLAQFPPSNLGSAPGTDLKIWGFTGTLEVMPTDFFGLRAELVHRVANVGYFAGTGGTTSPDGYLPDPAGAFVPDTAKSQTLIVLAANFRL